MKILNIILERLSENSTWRGIIMLATVLGMKLDPELQTQILGAGLSLVGIINIIRKGNK